MLQQRNEIALKMREDKVKRNEGQEKIKCKKGKFQSIVISNFTLYSYPITLDVHCIHYLSICTS